MKEKIICLAQDAFLSGYFAKDDGKQIFLICKMGGEFVMKKKVERGRKFLAWADLRFIKYLDKPKRRKT